MTRTLKAVYVAELLDVLPTYFKCNYYLIILFTFMNMYLSCLGVLITSGGILKIIDK